MWMANATYTGSNNPQNLPAYTLVSAGVSTALERGELTFAASNIFNTYGGIFATPENAVPYMTPSGLTIPTIARPNTPRAVFRDLYRAFRPRCAAACAGAADGRRRPRRARPRWFLRAVHQPLPQTPPSDPFALNPSPMCTADAQKTAQALLGGLKAYTQQIEAAKGPNGYPDDDGPRRTFPESTSRIMD